MRFPSAAPEAETLITSPLGSSRPKAVTVVNWDAETAAAAAAALGSGMRDRQILYPVPLPPRLLLLPQLGVV